MKKDRAERALYQLGYEIDWECTGRDQFGAWVGVIDAIGRNCIDGDCRGEVVHGENASDWYKNAIEAAESYGRPRPCPEPEGQCDFHDEIKG